MALTGRVASISSGATEISGALTEFTDPFWGQSKEDCTCLTGKNGVAMKSTKPTIPERIAAHRSHEGAVARVSGRERGFFFLVARLSDTAISVRHPAGELERPHARVGWAELSVALRLSVLVCNETNTCSRWGLTSVSGPLWWVVCRTR